MSPDPKRAYIVSHTHWDREWYLTYHQYRPWLVRVMKRLLDQLEQEEEYRHFVLDGQTVILEDYLEVCPEDRERLQRLVSEGRLSLGPWYILPDELLVSGEATVRNLLLGRQAARAIGPVQPVGYLPDSFGHIAQLPQILRRAGIGTFVYTRGGGPEVHRLGLEYRWEAPDGSQVLAVNQHGGYCNAGGLGFQEIWHAHTRREVDPARAVEQIRHLFQGMAERSNGDLALINNGCDHFPPQQEFPRILQTLRKAWPETEFLHTGLEEYLTAVEEAGIATETHRGELLSGHRHHILSGVWSARMYLKQANEEAQGLLGRVLEPLAAYGFFLLDQPYPAGQIDYAWKLLLKNHPHDSICGCSIDPVHREMETRFAGVQETAEKLLVDLMEEWTPNFGRQAEQDRDTLICVANPLPERRTAVVERLVVLQPLGYDLDRLELIDHRGRPVPMQVVDRMFLERFWGIDYRRELTAERQQALLQTYLDQFGRRILGTREDQETRDCFLRVQFLAEDLPPVGHAVFQLRERPAGAAPIEPARGVTVQGSSLENELLRATLHPDGTVDLIHRESGRAYPGLNRLEDTGDIGDEYDHCPAPQDERVTSEGCRGTVRLVEDTGLRATLEVEFELSIPCSITPGRSRRAPERTACPVRIRLSLEAGSPLAEVELRFSNRAEDHRLRAVFPTGLRTEHLVSDGHFLWNRRPLDQPAGEDWVQPPPGPYPQQDFSLVQEGRDGLALLNRGLPEIEITRGPDHRARLHLTLLRCVGWLSRDDFSTRRHSNAGPTLATPEAQCLGKHRFRYSLLPFTGDPIEADIAGWSDRYRSPPLTLQGVPDQARPAGQGLLRQSTRRSRITAIKRHQDRPTLIVRLYNLTGSPLIESLEPGFPVRAAWRTDLLEERLESLTPTGEGLLRLELGPHEIATLEIQPDETP